MDPELERVLRGFDEAREFARTFRFEITEEYLRLIAKVEALPRNQPGSDKTGVWTALQTYEQFFRLARPAPNRT